ncbi:MAG: chaperone modulator CbpM [Fimbriimonadaceae bacterium]|nr:chaperone modulator CbpM [Chitinophagales bacterium]
METENFITIRQFCSHYNIDLTFIHTLNDYGLIEITTVEEIPYIQKECIKDIEKMIRLHYDLEINMEGIDAISYLLQRVNSMQAELNMLKNRLSLYENE